MQDLIVEVSRRIKKDLGLEDTITPKFIEFQELLEELRESNIDNNAFTSILQTARKRGVVVNQKLKIEPHKKMIYSLIPPFSISSEDVILNSVFKGGEKKISNLDKKRLIYEILLAPLFLDFKIKRRLKYYCQLHYLDCLKYSLFPRILESDFKALELSTFFESLSETFKYTRAAIFETYVYKRIGEEFEKYFNILPSDELKNLSKSLDTNHIERYFEPLEINLSLFREIADLNFLGVYKGEKSVSYKDFFEDDDINNILWVYGFKRKDSWSKYIF